MGGKTLTIAGSGFGNAANSGVGQGALVGNANNSTWGGSLVLGAGATVGAANGQTLNIGGVVSGTDLTKVNAGAVTLLNANTFTGNVTVAVGQLALANTNAYTGTTAVLSNAANNGGANFVGGTLALNLLGSALNTSSITVNGGAAITIDNTQINLTNRLSDTTPISLNTATLNFLEYNVPGAASSETIGPVTLGSGHSTIIAGVPFASGANVLGGVGAPTGLIQMPGVSSALTLASIARNPGATLNVQGVNIGTATNKVSITAAIPAAMQITGVGSAGPATILPAIEVNGANNQGNFATIGATASPRSSTTSRRPLPRTGS